MRISGSGNPPGVEAGGTSNAPHPASAKGTENTQTTDQLAISEAAGALSSRGDRVQQLRLQFESGSYSESSAGIAQHLISGALNRGA
jgi:anti-sigma28 factor (negative regulator of flagellin synthesis)